MTVTARVQCGNRSFVLRVLPDPNAPSGCLAEIWDGKKQVYALGIPNNKTIDEAKREAKWALSSYIKAKRLVCPDFKLNWTEL
jgi:hypothetical protein